eukprot:1160449-Pelagomonas_calceolata.AAC.2
MMVTLDNSVCMPKQDNTSSSQKTTLYSQAPAKQYKQKATLFARPSKAALKLDLKMHTHVHTHLSRVRSHRVHDDDGGFAKLPLPALLPLLQPCTIPSTTRRSGHLTS